MPDSFWESVPGASPLQQGDVLRACRVPILAGNYTEGEEAVADLHEYDVIVLSQSCDLAKTNPPRLVATSPIFLIAEFEKENAVMAKEWEPVRQGRREGLHLLGSSQDPGDNSSCYVVDFHEIYSVPTEYLNSLAASAKDRLRLRSPYLEHFSQAFARFFMRVGLPSDIPRF